MKDLIITIDANTRKASVSKTFAGITGENLQGNIIFDFVGEFIDGTGYLDFDNGQKYSVQMTKEENRYTAPIHNSLLQKIGKVKIQLRIEQTTEQTTVAIFKSRIIELPVFEALDPSEMPVDYAKLGEKIIDTNGTFNASDDGLDGYSEVTVNIQTGQDPIAIIEGTLEELNDNSITTIKEMKFANITSLRTAKGENVTSIGNGAFTGCSELEEIDFPKCTTITAGSNYNDMNNNRVGTFAGATKLNKINLPKVTNIGTRALENAGLNTTADKVILNIESCTVINDRGLNSIGGNKYVEELNLPECKTIRSYGLQNWGGSLHINLPKCETIESYALAFNTSSRAHPSILNLPAIKTIGSSAFRNWNVVSIILGQATSVASSAFTTGSTLRYITLGGDTVCSIGSTTAFGSLSSSTPVTVYVKSELIASYQTATNWSTLYNDGKVIFEALTE